ncbi:hypothetical protein OSTOST_14311, partial [Ostertagia ostertagi]
MFNANDPTSSTPSVILLLTLKAKKLLDKDVFSKSDPMCVVSQYVGRLTGRPILIECFDYDWDGGNAPRKGDKYKNSGTLEFNGVELLKQYSFLDFIAG